MSVPRVDDVFATEHFWPSLAPELVMALAQRMGRAPGWRATVLLPAQQTAIGLFTASGADDVAAALAQVALPAHGISPAMLLSRGPEVVSMSCSTEATESPHWLV